MALFLMILRKMAKNRWLELSLLIGLIISVALASSMPIYTHAILQRMLIKDLEVQQSDTQRFPGLVNNHAFFTEVKDGANRMRDAEAYMSEHIKQFGLPILQSTITRSTKTFELTPSDPSKVDPKEKRYGEITAMTDLEKHIRLVDGVMPGAKLVDGVYEAWVFPELLTKLKIVLGNEVTVKSEEQNRNIRIKPVAVIDRADLADVYWTTNTMPDLSSRFFIPASLFEQELTKGSKFIDQLTYWNYALDYHQLKLEGLDTYITANAQMEEYAWNHLETYKSFNQTIVTLTTYDDKEKKLRILLWSLNVPVSILLAFYLFMVANLITERQKTEIAVLRSRGASRTQILLGYVIEGILLGGIALLVGPLLGLQLTQILGASNGFLSFVQRAAMEVKLNREAYQYGVIAVVASVGMTLIPAVLATRVSIVGHKQTLARKNKLSFVHKIYLDVVLLAVSMYLLQSFNRRMGDLVALGLDSMDMKVDPLLFVVPAIFIFALGLVVLRIYPWIIQLIYIIGRKWWPPYLYSTLLQVGRSTTQYQFIMLFIIMTLATGIFSASAARTMNKNVEEKIHYKNGADIVLQTTWDNDAPPPQSGPPGAAGEANASGSASGGNKRVQYVEPPFMPFSQLTGVESAARVFKKQDAYIALGKDTKKTTLMGIDTDDFGRTAWFRDQLLDHHFYEYLNVLATDSKAVLISRSIADEIGAKVGDVVRIGWNDVEGATSVVYGIIDYWPSWNPNPVLAAPTSSSSTSSSTSTKPTKVDMPKLVIGHLSFIQNNLAVEPYDVWLKLKPDMTSQALYELLEQKHMSVTRLVDTNMMVIRSKNDPFQLAVNGVMTLGFLIAISISFIGFLLYWLLSLYGQILQFGVLRAMGISFRQLIGMLVAEQLLTSGAAVIIGMITGNAASRLFVPLFQLTFDSSSQVPPFQVRFDPQDQLHLYVIVIIMIGIGLLLLGTMLSRIKIHQAVKLGED
ncbi:FtsX-like permease family protein [Paenibacillus qinlingensis]|uniref:ABC transport system permease protein n=1 Tax=Paenibacillus qinlingensis TaxID=1837343 RepID=A0ABU1NZR9_9BACL|nr:FtsX-like permease family protein [Paenibacillus qinlingensis]MDR6552993.1 putative ABC transport system permease protein [Paenibacillus qinlingensis]